MSKRSTSENNFEFIVKKLKKLEKEVKRSRHPRSILSSSESSTSSCTSRASSPDLESQAPYSILENLPSEITDINTVQSIQPEAPVIPEATKETTVNTNLSEVLGEDPTIDIQYGPDINSELAIRLAHIATSGLNKETRDVLLKKYLVPANCIKISAPQLNVEIKAALPDLAIKRDKCIETRQKTIAAGIASLCRIISKQLDSKDINNEITKDLMDIARLLCDIQYSESETRRNFALFSVKKELKDQLTQTKIDKCLFGSDFAETLKTAKAVTKSSADLKRDLPEKSQAMPSTSKNNLNWKTRTVARRQQPVTQTRHQPASSSSTQRETSRNYSQRRRHHKQSRRD